MDSDELLQKLLRLNTVSLRVEKGESLVKEIFDIGLNVRQGRLPDNEETRVSTVNFWKILDKLHSACQTLRQTGSGQVTTVSLSRESTCCPSLLATWALNSAPFWQNATSSLLPKWATSKFRIPPSRCFSISLRRHTTDRKHSRWSEF